MEKTLNLPEELVGRLPEAEEQVVQILELGLQALDQESGKHEVESDLESTVWSAAVRKLLINRRRNSRQPPPSTEELIAYARDELEVTERESFLEQLAVHPESIRDLIDLIEFGRDEAPDDTEKQEVSEALELFRSRLESRPEVPEEKKLRVSETSRPRPRLAWAAALLIGAGGAWLLALLGSQIGQPPTPHYAAVIDVATSRGARTFPVSSDAPDVLIILPDVELPAGSDQASLRISKPNGDIVYQDSFHRSSDRGIRLYLSLPSKDLPPGSYEIQISIPRLDTRSDVREYRFAIEPSAAER